ncbi:hypothetical protein [Paraburkholderia xenovorans]|jgi:hypothetical protein
MQQMLSDIRNAYRDAPDTASTGKGNYSLLLDAFELQWQSLAPAPESEIEYRKNLVGGGRGFFDPGTMQDRIGHARDHVNDANSLPPAAGREIAENLLALLRKTSPAVINAMQPLVQPVHAAVMAGQL